MPHARKHQLTSFLLYHIFNRSNGGVAIFHNDDDRQYFIKLLREYSNEFNMMIYHWVVMPNHYHLLVEIGEPEKLSRIIAGLNRAYTYYHHKKYESVGFLWQGRFKSQPIQKENYLTVCGRYIERNPVEAGIVSEACDYSYSSAIFYCFGYIDGLTIQDPLFIQFGLECTQRRLAYRRFLKDFNQEEEKSFATLESPQGDAEFIRKLIKLKGHYFPRRAGKAPRRNSFVTP